MALTEEKIFSRINRKIHNAKGKLGEDSDFRDNLNEALRDLRLDVDLVSAKRVSLPFFIFEDVYEYAAPVDLDYDKTIKLNVQDEDYLNTQFDRIDPNDFFSAQSPLNKAISTNREWYLNTASDLNIEANPNKMAVSFENGTPYLLIRNKLSGSSKQALVQTSEVTPTDTSGGSWSVSGDGSNLRADSARFKTSNASLACDSDGNTTSISFTNSTFTAVDLTSYKNKGELHVWVYIPVTTPEDVTIVADWGSDSSNYYTQTATTQKRGMAFHVGWNLVSFPWINLTSTTGSPTVTAIDYFKLTITNAVAVAAQGYHIDAPTFRLGKEVTMDFYSKYLVVSSTGIRKEEFTTTSDETLLQGQEVNLLIVKAAELASEDLREGDDAINREKKYEKKKKRIEERYPSEVSIEGGTYYRV